VIHVTKVCDNGLWRGRINQKEGNFKFIDVELPIPHHLKDFKSCSMKRGEKSKSVSDLLSAIHLENLTSVFVLNGYDSSDDFKNLSVDDLEYLGIDDHVKDKILKSVDNISKDTEIRSDNVTQAKIQDSGFNSSDSDFSEKNSENYFLPTSSYLFPSTNS